MKTTVLTFTAFLMFFSVAFSANKPILNGENDELNYSVGHQVGRDLVRQQVEVNPAALMQGIIDATQGNEPLVSFEKMIDTLAQLREDIVKLAEQQKLDVRQAGVRFLKENESKADVETLDSGLQYKVLQSGDGAIAVSGDMVRVTYSGQDVYGQVFDSTSRDGVVAPVEFKVDNVIPGWSEAMKMMTEGSEWELYIPHYLAFKDAGPLAGQTVIYKIKLLKVNP